MERKAVSAVMLTLLLMSMLTLAFNIQPVEAEHKTWIVGDGGPFTYGTTQGSSLRAVSESFCTSAVDIIHPQPGQFAHYFMQFYYPVPNFGWWNTSYIEYVQPHVINTTQKTVQPEGSGTFWCTVDATNRLVTDTDPDFWWNQTWYVFWIETDVTVGSVINYWIGTATIVGSQTLHVVGLDIDCWVALYIYDTYSYELSWYDKISGLMVKDQFFAEGELYGDLNLIATNIPIGEKLQTSTYFNLNPNPVNVGETVALKGVLVDEFCQPLDYETVELFARPLAGSWRHITSLTTNGYGTFTWQKVILLQGIFIFAVYYPGNETYRPSHNLAALIVQ